MSSEAGPPLICRHAELADAAATAALGVALGALLRAGDFVALIGEMGAGKTTLTRALALGLGVDAPDEVASPTYLLVVEHDGPLPLLHVDAYLPEKTRGFLLDGGLDYLSESGGVTVVEWADRIRDLWPERVLQVELLPTPSGGRRARLLGSAAAFGWLEEIPLDA